MRRRKGSKPSGRLLQSQNGGRRCRRLPGRTPETIDQIEIAGIQAKLDAIKARRGNRTGAGSHLDQMQATEDENGRHHGPQRHGQNDLKNPADYSDAMYKLDELDYGRDWDGYTYA